MTNEARVSVRDGRNRRRNRRGLAGRQAKGRSVCVSLENMKKVKGVHVAAIRQESYLSDDDVLSAVMSAAERRNCYILFDIYSAAKKRERERDIYRGREIQ